jgi:16S rRNA (adenine1518-N6/adenine1519-N6)-dimethyltransferase
MEPPRRRVRGPARPNASAYLLGRAAIEGSAIARVKRLLAERGLSPRRRFGQNFLVREDLAERIVEHCRLADDDVALEIGPGAGALTARLAARVRTLVAVEKDVGLAAFLREELAEVRQVELVEGDFLEVDLAATAREHGAERLVVVGNIPYNITTPVLERIFAQQRAVRSAVLLVQKEYAERLAAAAGTPEYGALTLFARYHALLEPLMGVRASAFWPRPEVDSMLVRFTPREQPPVEADEALLFRIIRGSFQMRRKQLANTLEAALGLDGSAVERLCRAAGIDGRRRGETLTLDEFAKLARAAERLGARPAEDAEREARGDG